MTEAVPVRDAATVVLLRDGATGIEAWLLTRVTQMVFAAGMSVFPGGRLDVRDADLPFSGDGIVEAAARFGCTEEQARGLIGAAVRETYEETGVLLTAPPADLSHARHDVESGRLWFGDLLRESGVAVDSSALHPWARWVTPAGEVRRYDTRFFVGALPDTAEARDETTESSEASWVPVREALDQARRGERKMLPPTLATLSSLLQFASVSEALASAPSRSLHPVRPEIQLTEDGRVIVHLPGGERVEIPRAMLA
jgi:8-oxo-dGTP pyrophosphatase MutT (NUDIX family)